MRLITKQELDTIPMISRREFWTNYLPIGHSVAVDIDVIVTRVKADLFEWEQDNQFVDWEGDYNQDKTKDFYDSHVLVNILNTRLYWSIEWWICKQTGCSQNMYWMKNVIADHKHLSTQERYKIYKERLEQMSLIIAQG